MGKGWLRFFACVRQLLLAAAAGRTSSHQSLAWSRHLPPREHHPSSAAAGKDAPNSLKHPAASLRLRPGCVSRTAAAATAEQAQVNLVQGNVRHWSRLALVSWVLL